MILENYWDGNKFIIPKWQPWTPPAKQQPAAVPAIPAAAPQTMRPKLAYESPHTSSDDNDPPRWNETPAPRVVSQAPILTAPMPGPDTPGAVTVGVHPGAGFLSVPYGVPPSSNFKVGGSEYIPAPYWGDQRSNINLDKGDTIDNATSAGVNRPTAGGGVRESDLSRISNYEKVFGARPDPTFKEREEEKENRALSFNARNLGAAAQISPGSKDGWRSLFSDPSGNQTTLGQIVNNPLNIGGGFRNAAAAKSASAARGESPFMQGLSGFSGFVPPLVSAMVPGAPGLGLLGGFLNSLGFHHDFGDSETDLSTLALDPSTGTLSAAMNPYAPGGYTYQGGQQNVINALMDLPGETMLDVGPGGKMTINEYFDDALESENYLESDVSGSDLGDDWSGVDTDDWGSFY